MNVCLKNFFFFLFFPIQLQEKSLDGSHEESVAVAEEDNKSLDGSHEESVAVTEEDKPLGK